jgi:hypothetical protein
MSTRRQVVDDWFRRVWAEEDTTAIDEMFMPDGEARGLGANTLVGPAGFKRFHAALCAQLSNIVITVDKSIEEGEWISVVCTLRAKSQQTGLPVTMTGSVMVRIVDGKLTEAYNHWDFLTLFSALGSLPPRTFETALAGQSII